MPTPNAPTGPYTVTAGTDCLGNPCSHVVGPDGFYETMSKVGVANFACNIANRAYAAGKRAVEGDLVLAARQVVKGIRGHADVVNSADDDESDIDSVKLSDLRALKSALASAGQEVKHGG